MTVLRYTPPKVTMRPMYKPKRKVNDFIERCEALNCFPKSKK